MSLENEISRLASAAERIASTLEKAYLRKDTGYEGASGSVYYIENKAVAKKEPDAAVADETPVEAAAPKKPAGKAKAKAVTEVTPASATSDAPSIEDVRKAVLAYQAKHGGKKTLETLKKLSGVAVLSSVAVENYAKLIGQFNEALNA